MIGLDSATSAALKSVKGAGSNLIREMATKRFASEAEANGRMVSPLPHP